MSECEDLASGWWDSRGSKSRDGWERKFAENDRPAEYVVYVFCFETNDKDHPYGLYVGSTNKSPEDRFAVHAAGGEYATGIFKRNRGSEACKPLFLRPDIYDHLPLWRTRQLAEKAEGYLARQLQAAVPKGVWVYSDKKSKSKSKKAKSKRNQKKNG